MIDSSGRVTRSITRRLTARLATRWRELRPGGEILHRDLGLNPPPPVDEDWIAAAFGSASDRTATAREALALSDTLIAELVRADAIVLGVPMYNFGVPAQLKAYIDQVVRVGETFAFDADAPEPYRPMLPAKPVVVITSAGDGAIHPGGALAHQNFLEPHLQTVLGFIGLTDLTFVRVGYDEYQDQRLKHSLAAAETAVDELAGRLARPAYRKAEERVAG